MFLIMPQPSSQIPVRLTIASGVLLSIFALWVNILAQAPTSAFDTTKDVLGWLMLSGGFISMAVAIGYGFLKKQKYENIKKESDEWQGVAESRGERIKDLKYQYEEAVARFTLQLTNGELEIKSRDTKIQGLEVSHEVIVRQNLQMKAILKQLRHDGLWNGNESDI